MVKKGIGKTCWVSIIIFFVIGLAGCFPGAKKPYILREFVFDYQAQPEAAEIPFKESLRVERFTVVQVYNTQAMLYRPETYRVAQYHGNRWSVNPGDLVSDFLIRDIGNQKIFEAVFSYRDGAGARYLLSGNIEEFCEVDNSEGSVALLSVVATLKDGWSKDATKIIIFQRRYRISKPLQEKSAEGLARGMSSAMDEFSRTLLKDIVAELRSVSQ